MRGMLWKKGTLLLLCVCLLFVLGIPVLGSETVSGTVSYGLQVLASQTEMVLSMPVGNEIVFSADAFARGLNLSKIRYITIASLPEVTAGELCVGSTRVVVGQTVTAEQLPYLSFAAASDDVAHASFTFRANGVEITHTCELYFLTRSNEIPTLSTAPELSLVASTYQGLAVHGMLSAYDPDGDPLIFEIVSYPEHGTVKLQDRTTGKYVYRPYDNYAGSDSFTYLARDPYGNYSASAEVKVSVRMPSTSVKYADLEDSAAYPAALAMTENGVMSGTQIGNQYYFCPNEGVTRAEFVVMAMHAMGMSEVPQTTHTGFADDAEIPVSMKGYLSVAYAMGYIDGSLVNGSLCFLPNEEITRAQAAVILYRMLEPNSPAVLPTFADGAQIPTWAKDAISSLYALGIYQSDTGSVSANDVLTRAQTAQILAKVMEYTA